MGPLRYDEFTRVNHERRGKTNDSRYRALRVVSSRTAGLSRRCFLGGGHTISVTLDLKD